MTTTPTASPELPDLDLFKMERAATKWAEVHFRHAINFTRADFDIVLAAWKAATSQAIAARRAKPEGEAPQAVQFYRRAPNENWRETTAEHIAHLKQYPGFEYRTLYTAPAATLSPLCGAQHAESGKEPEPFKWPNGCDKTIPRALRYLASNPRPSGGEQPFNGEHLHQLAGEMEAAAHALAVQQAAAPANSVEFDGIKTSAPGTPEAPKGGVA